MMATLLRLPLPLPLQSPLIFKQSNRHHHRSNSSVYFSPSPSPISPLSLSDSFIIKARSFSSLVVHCSTTAENPDAELKPDGEIQEEEEFSTTRLLAQNVPWTYTPDDVRSLFEKYGSVLDVELSMYNRTKNRGLAFVTMGSPKEASEALKQLDLSEVEGRVIRMNYAKPRKPKPAPPVKERPAPALKYNLFVGNLAFEARAKTLKEFFKSEGANVVSAEVIFHTNPRRSAGYGFVSFETKEEAEAALSAFQGKEFMGKRIRVAYGRQFRQLTSGEGSKSDDKPEESNSVIEQVVTSDTN